MPIGAARAISTRYADAIVAFEKDGAEIAHGLIEPTGGGTVFTVEHTFGANANAFTVHFGWEGTGNISSAVLDPAGINLTLTPIVTTGSPHQIGAGNNKVAAWGAWGLSGVTGDKDVQLTFSAAITQAVVIATQSYAGAANAAPTPVDSSTTDTDTSTSISLSLTAPNADGIAKVIINANANATFTESGYTQTFQHQETEFTINHGEQVGSLTNPEVVGATLGSAQRLAGLAFVVNPPTGDEEPPPEGSTLFSYDLPGSTSDAWQVVPTGQTSTTQTAQALFGNQHMAFRFAGVDIDQGATLLEAFLQFTAGATTTGSVTYRIHGFLSTNLSVFVAGADNFNISTRAVTTAFVDWSPGDWTSGGRGAAQLTPDISAIVEEIVGQGGWAAGNALGFRIHRTSASGSRSFAMWDHATLQEATFFGEWEP